MLTVLLTTENNKITLNRKNMYILHLLLLCPISNKCFCHCNWSIKLKISYYVPIGLFMEMSITIWRTWWLRKKSLPSFTTLQSMTGTSLIVSVQTNKIEEIQSWLRPSKFFHSWNNNDTACIHVNNDSRFNSG